MMLPARMSRILLGGHVSRMEDAIEALHQAGVMHLEDYDGEGLTQIGTPLEAGDEASALLVRVRGLQKSIGAEDMPARALASEDEAAILEEAESASRNALDEVSSIRTAMSLRQSEIQALEPFAQVPFDLSVVDGLEHVRAFIGTARTTPRIPVSHEIESAPYGSGVALAVFVRRSDAAQAEKALQDAGFAPATLPTGRAGTPADRLTQLYSQRAEDEARLKAAEADVEVLRAHWGPKLAALAGTLTEKVDKTQAPLRFGVTERTFHAEGWVPRGDAERLKRALAGKLGNGLYLEELGDTTGSHSGKTHEGAEAHVAGHDDHHDHGPGHEPPVALRNPAVAKPYEWMLGLLGRPRYKEIDPTRLMLIFFPLFFGLMVGDVLVGLAIALLGLWLKKNSLVGIGGPAVGRALFAGGIMAMIVGAFVFGEALGIHFVVDDHALDEGELSWEAILYGKDEVLHGEAGFPHDGFIYKDVSHAAGHEVPDPRTESTDPLSEGDAATSGFTTHATEATEQGGLLSMFKPHGTTHLSLAGVVNLGYYSKIHDVQALLLWSVLIGLVHIVLGLLIGFRNVAVGHGMNLAVQEKASWLGILFGSLIGVAGLQAQSTILAAVGFGLAAMSVVLLWIGTAKVLGVGFISVLEIPSLAGNILSYTRLAAIGASKAGIVIAIIAIASLASGGALNLVWWLIYLIGMVAITLLAALSGGLQSLRLQFVEFFSKFYEGGGRPYVPFGRRAP